MCQTWCNVDPPPSPWLRTLASQSSFMHLLSCFLVGLSEAGSARPLEGEEGEEGGLRGGVTARGPVGVHGGRGGCEPRAAWLLACCPHPGGTLVTHTAHVCWAVDNVT